MECKVCSFFGHRKIFNREGIRARLKEQVENLIKFGYKRFLIGTHGEFDDLVAEVCLELKNKNKEIKLCLVYTTTKILKTKPEYINKNFEICIYDIEEIYFKKIIVYTNQKMIEESDIIICYVDNKLSKSGARDIIKYANKKNKKIINIYKKEDEPFYSLTKEEKDIELKKYLKMD